MITATRRIQFAAGHRVFGHEGKCRWLHGHNFVAFLTAAAADLDAVIIAPPGSSRDSRPGR